MPKLRAALGLWIATQIGGLTLAAVFSCASCGEALAASPWLDCMSSQSILNCAVQCQNKFGGSFQEGGRSYPCAQKRCFSRCDGLTLSDGTVMFPAKPKAHPSAAPSVAGQQSNTQVNERLARGMSDYLRGAYDDAIAEFTEVLRLKPDNDEALNNRGAAYDGKGDHDRAIADYSAAIRLKPGDVDALNNRGFAYAAKGDQDRAIADYSEAIRLKPTFANPYGHRARAYLAKGDLPRAVADADEATRLDPKYFPGYLARGEIREKSGDIRGALDDFERALALNSDLAEARDGRERVLSALTAAARPTPTPTIAAKPEPTPAVVAAPPGRRVALIVANGAYREAALANPKIDADLVAASLETTGFAVTVKKDLALDAFEQSINEFADSARGADVALFYFAGHGFSVASGGRQQNLLMATDADFQAKTGLALERGGEALEHVEETIIGHARATLIFVDACRNIPVVASRGVGGRGFAPIDASAFEGAFVVISTRQGKMAEDGADGQGSPFARAFAAIAPTPRLRIDDAYARIREKVRAETSGEQVPDVVRSDLPEGGLVLMPAP